MAEPSSLEAPYNVVTDNLEQVVCPDDVMSITTEGSNWCFVEAEEGEMPVEEMLMSDAEEKSDEEWSEMPEPTVEEKPEPSMEAASSALVLWSNPFELGHPLLAQCEGHGGDVTSSWAQALEGFPAVPSIFCLGRIEVSPAAAGCRPSSATLSVVARVAVFNDSPCTWPEETALRIVAGDCLGLPELHCGGLPPGCGAELVLDLEVPAEATRGMGGRSCWVLADADGEPFGPVLVVEVMWT